jgi:hypothetical protein
VQDAPVPDSPTERPSGPNRGCLDELWTLRGIVAIIFVTPYGVSELVAGKVRNGLLLLALALVCCWQTYVALRPAGYRLGAHRKERKATRDQSE